MSIVKTVKKIFRHILFSLLLFVVFVYRLFLGKANKKVNPPQKVVVIQFAKLGDMVCTTPMFRAIKNIFPQTKVYVVGSVVNKAVLDNNVDVDHYLVYKKNFLSILGELRREHIGFACLCGPNLIGLALLLLSGVPCVAAPQIKGGWSPLETWYYRMMRKYTVVCPHTIGFYAPREYLRLLEPIGIFTDDTKKHLVFSQNARVKVYELFSKFGINPIKDVIVGIIPSAGNRIKQWHTANFAKVADYLFERYHTKIILLGAPSDCAQAQAVLDSVKIGTNLYNTAGLLSVDELKFLISNLDMLVGVDTGPIYIAEAFDVATVDIIGPVDENEQPPIGPRNLIVKAIRRAPVLHVMNARVYDYDEARRQVDSITVEEVVKAVDNLIDIVSKKTIV